MKNFKIVLATLVVAALSIMVSSFTIKSYNSRAFAATCYHLGNNVLIDVATINNPANVGEMSKINDSNHDGTPDVGNWFLRSPFDPATDCPSTSKVCGICFDNGTTGLILQTVLNELVARLKAGTFTFADGATFQSTSQPTVSITVYEYDPNA